MYQRHIILAEFPTEEIFTLVCPPWGRERPFCVEGMEYSVNTTNHRLRCFKRSSICACCGIEGTRFRLEIQAQEWEAGCRKPSLNLYAADGTDMTVDHILPAHLGGDKFMGNLQTMCSHCNQKKGRFHPANYRMGNKSCGKCRRCFKDRIPLHGEIRRLLLNRSGWRVPLEEINRLLMSGGIELLEASDDGQLRLEMRDADGKSAESIQRILQLAAGTSRLCDRCGIDGNPSELLRVVGDRPRRLCRECFDDVERRHHRKMGNGDA
jgi:hypothetical protein